MNSLDWRIKSYETNLHRLESLLVLHLRVPCLNSHSSLPIAEPIVIVTCVSWYLRFSLSLRDREELMAERGLTVDHTTIWPWCQTYGPEVLRRLQGEVKRKRSIWHMDETFVRIAGRWFTCSCA